MKTTVNEGLKWGGICGLIGLLIMFGSWAAGLNTFITFQFWGNFIPYVIVILIVTGLQLRKERNNVLPYGEALKFAFLTYVITAVIMALGTYVLYNLIDPELTLKSFQAAEPKTRALMEKFGAGEDKIEEALRKGAEDAAKGTGLGKIFLGTGLFLIWDFIKSLLIALIIRKEEKFAD